MSSDLDIKKEQIYEAFSETFDRELAYSAVILSEDEKMTLDDDLEFQARLNRAHVEEKVKIIQNFRTFMSSEDERIRFKATVDLAMIIYPEFFDISRKKSKPNSSILDQMDETDIEYYFDEVKKQIKSDKKSKK